VVRGLAHLVETSREPVDPASLNFFRVAFGVLLLAEITRYFAYDWIADHYLKPELLFKYYGFEWVTLWPGDGLYWHFGAMGLFAAMLALGFLYRIAAVGLFLCFAYVFLLEQANYLNQYYLVLCVAFLLCFLPAHRGWSVDARLGLTSGPAVVPRWSIWALRLQFELVLVYAGLVKINGDWLRGEPLGLWLSEEAGLPLVGSWLRLSGVSVTAAWAVVLLHLAGAILLLRRRSRFPVFIVYVAFHLTSSLLFHLGLFPWLTLAGMLMFFDPEWPKQAWSRLDSRTPAVPPRALTGSSMSRPGVVTYTCLSVFFALQLLVPWRFVLYPGHVAWTGEGEWFAWRMKLDDKRADARFIVIDQDSGRRWDIDPIDRLRSRQVLVMAARPDMIVQFARHLEAVWIKREGVRDVQVRALVMCSLNGRPAAPLIDPEIDLTTVSQTLKAQEWVIPLAIALESVAARAKTR
jgi:vitamin K-dependent gamma-carboxylase